MFQRHICVHVLNDRPAKPKPSATLGRLHVAALAVAAKCDPRTVAKYLDTDAFVNASIVGAIERELRRRKLGHLTRADRAAAAGAVASVPEPGEAA